MKMGRDDAFVFLPVVFSRGLSLSAALPILSCLSPLLSLHSPSHWGQHLDAANSLCAAGVFNVVCNRTC